MFEEKNGRFFCYLDLYGHEACRKWLTSGFFLTVIPYVPSVVLRHSFDNNIGFIHVRVNEADEEPIALADIYRMDGTCLVEHWDVTQARPANATNPIAMF